MKNKMIVVIGVLIVLIIGVLVVFYNQKEKTDGEKFKEEYESLNNTKSSSGKTIRSLFIAKDNPIVYSSAEEVIKMMDQEENFAIYFGFASCPWCRSVIASLLEVAEDLKIEKIYYVDVTDISDVMVLDENKEAITEKKGTDAYYELLERLDNLLSDYSLKTEDGEEVATGEKRIYAPNIVSIINGKGENLTTGISDEQTDGYMELTEEMQKDSYNKIKCALECLIEEATTCTKNAC